MVTETQEIVMGSKDLTHIIKGERTKRQSPVSPLRLAVTSTSSCCGESGGERERMNHSTIDFADSSTGGEEDMANCLILLAQGSHKTSAKLYSPAAKSSSAGSYVYRCKTCNRCFPSFQALGGHRASHKKSNNNKVGSEGKKGIIVEYDDVNNTASTALSLKISNRSFYGGSNINANITNVKSNKVHECSICGAEFSSGQALGGHMRRHRAVFSSSTSTTPTLSVTPAMSVVASCSPDQSQESKKPRNSLRLDLNLPAPEDDVRESQFHFPSKEQVLVFSASSLVDCHY